MAEAGAPSPQLDTVPVYALYVLAYLSVLVRIVLRTPTEGLVGPASYGLMAVYLALSIAHPAMSRRWRPWTHVFLALQCGVMGALLLTWPVIDYYAVLGIGLSIVATRDLSPHASIFWLAAIIASFSLGLALSYGLGGAIGYIPIYVVACLLIGLYSRSSVRAEAARARSEALLAELTEANRQLRAYAVQAEEGAAAQERASLARDLHDAATQTVFSMNLTAEAARMAVTEDPAQVPGLLDRLQELARDALGEMRALVRELRPAPVAEVGLVKSLERHAATRERRDGLRVSLAVEGEERGSPEAREALFQTAREALSNVAKHAGVREASVELAFGAAEARLRVADRGRGFDPAAARRPDSYGLAAMQERIESLGGTLALRAAPGAGVEVEATIPLGRGAGAHDEEAC